MPKARRRKLNEGKKKIVAVSSGIQVLSDTIEANAFAGGPIKTKPDEALFFIDKKPDKQVGKKITYIERVLAKNPLIQAIKVDPGPSPVFQKRADRQVQNQLERIAKGLTVSQNNKGASGKIQRQRTELTDLWGEEKPAVPVEDLWVVPELLVKNTLGARDAIRPRKATDNLNKIKAVRVPEPAQSYNPVPAHHQEFITDVAEREIIRLNEEYRLKEETKRHIRRNSGGRISFTVSGPMSESEDDELENDDGEPKIVKKPVSSLNKLTKAQRNKQQRKRKVSAELQEKHAAKKMRIDIDRVKVLQNDVKEKLAKDEETAKKKKLKLEQLPQTTVRLGRRKFEELCPDVLLPDELAGNLRATKVVGSLIADRFRSFQERNMIEITLPSRSKKPRIRNKEVVRGNKPQHELAARTQALRKIGVL